MIPLLIVFAKNPRPGQVKTRLAEALGSDTAAALYRALAEGVLRRTQAPGAYARAVFFAPADSVREIEAWLPGESCVAQEGADLGARMASAFAWAFARGHETVVLVGTDVPALGRAHIHAALSALDAHDVVLGPAFDGGYYLIALRRPAPQLFEGIAWSTGAVLPQTLDRARAAGLRVATLASLGDVDDVAGLRREWAAVRELLSGALLAELLRAQPDLEGA